MEAMMPALRVLKEGRILKNIFLNEPPPADEESQEKSNGEANFFVGRHPDCHIVVEHPSISRFHLQICVQASSRRISVVDLSSGTKFSCSVRHPRNFIAAVHGTWISGIKLQPLVPVYLSDGDTIRIGGSSRIYELFWIPLRIAFEIANHQVENSMIDEYPTVQLDTPIHPKSPESIKPKAKEVISPTSPPRSETKVKSSSLLSRRSKSYGVLRAQTGRRRTEEEEEVDSPYEEDPIFSDKENIFPDSSPSNPKMTLHDIDRHDDDDDDDGLFQSDKENFPPSIPKMQEGKITRKEINSGRVQRIPFQPLTQNEHSTTEGEEEVVEEEKEDDNLCREDVIFSEKENIIVDALQSSPKMKRHDDDDEEGDDDDDDESFQSDKENCAPQVPEKEGVKTTRNEIITRGVQRIPFQPLSPRNLLSPGYIPSPRKRWNMVVDTGCLFDEESRKAIQLLQGVRGTRLIIPRMVIRELDGLRKRENHLLFRKTQKVAPVLQWIEECMVKTSWWIHVQSSTESLPAAPTPPVSPSGLAEILSPTADDHILDCAFLFREIKGDGPLVLLTNEISLKIKAMAEGLLCESPKEFKESLMSPWSERFLWADSSPRGATWSTTDTAGPMDSSTLHCCGAARTKGPAPPADAAKGLKLILLHNSRYALSNPIKV